MRRIDRKIFTAVTLTVVSGLALAGCASAGSDSATQGGSEETFSKVVIDTTSAVGANEIAKVGGFFDEEFGALGIDIEYTSLGTTSQMLEGFAAGKLDFTDMGYSGLPTGANAGVDFSVVGEASSGGGDILVTPIGGASTIAELEGATVASAKGSSGWALLVRALAEADMSTADIELIDLKPDEAMNAFSSGQIDAWAIWGGQAGSLDESNSQVLSSSEEIGLIPGAIAARGAVVADEVMMEAYLTARLAAVNWFIEDPAAVIAAIAEDRDMDSEMVEQFFTFSVPLAQPVSSETLVNYQAVADLFSAEGEIPTEIDIEPFVNNSAIDALISK